MKNKNIRKITFASMITAVYFVLCVFEGSLASGFLVNVRFAEGLLVFALFIPETIVGATLGCFLYNLLFGFGIYDALIGTVATLIGGIYILLIKKLLKNEALRLSLFGLGAIIMNAILVPIVLIISVPEVTWEMYWLEFGIVALGEAIAIYSVGISLYLISKKHILNYMEK